jgi:hypothetical protein
VKPLLLALACALLLASPAQAGSGMFVGAAEDDARTADPVEAYAKMELARLAGFDAIRLTSIWTPGLTAPPEREREILRTAVGAAQLHGIRVILSVYHRDQRTTPLTVAARAEFASYVAAIARELPAVRDFIIGNEPNLNLFWMPQFNANGTTASAGAYLRLLAASYDALKAVSPDINVIGGSVSPRGQDKPRSSRHTHSPTRFIAELGNAYRASRRTKPVMDAFAFHPYLIPSRLPPTFRNPRNTTIALSDYDKLVRALTDAFEWTAQPGSTLPIVYDEFGYQSQIPPEKAAAYTNVAAPAAQDFVDEATQATYYRQSLAIVQCQPTVTGMLLFHVSDETDALRWQSGLYYADDTPKTSLPSVREAVLATRAGAFARCPRQLVRLNPVRRVVFPEQTSYPSDHRTWAASLACDLPCTYEARIVPAGAPGVVAPLDLLAGRTELAAKGSALPVAPINVKLPAEPLLPGRYQLVLRVTELIRTGNAVVRISEPFEVTAAEIPAPAAG